jgi:hypothetical protein
MLVAQHDLVRVEQRDGRWPARAQEGRKELPCVCW